MKIYFVLIIALCFSCTSVLKDDSRINDFKLKLELLNPDLSIQQNYLIFENLMDNKRSFEYTGFDSSSAVDILIPAGLYNISYMGFINKTDTAYKLYNYAGAKNILINKDTDLELNVRLLKPDCSVSNENNSIIISICMNDIFDFVSLSSVSVKQGADRYRSSQFVFNKDNCSNEIIVPIQFSGGWYANISYQLKYKYEQAIVKKSGIDLSTSYFQDCFLGSF